LPINTFEIPTIFEDVVYVINNTFFDQKSSGPKVLFGAKPTHWPVADDNKSSNITIFSVPALV
jgi:hypothetical protein